ncbi:MAG: type II secretion system F family protein [Candidatus Thermoplasmatota archaeon]|nr:type II secretion system F family protein [Candidatus Thermoplasmatota archaeon]
MTKTKRIARELEEARQSIYEKKDRSRTVKIVSIALGTMFLLIAALNFLDIVNISFQPGVDTDGDGIPDEAAERPTRRFLNFLALAMMGFIGPYGFYVSKQHKKIRAIEKRLPDFLRDVAEAGRFGMTLAQAIVVAAQGRYGVLTSEIKRMAAQIDWGVPATAALRLFAERVKTPMVERIVAIIVKASDAGGDVADVLTMVSTDTKEVQMTEDERRITMSTYIAVIYISFAVFIVTIMILGATFLPKMQEAAGELSQGDGGLLSGTQGPLPQNIDEIIFNIQVAFYIAVIVHAMGDGILAGILDNGKIVNGLRHSFIMLLIAVGSFQMI